jgi:hypothetical protein
MNWHFRGTFGRRRNERGGLGHRSEACEERLLLSATANGPVRFVANSAGNASTPAPAPPRIVRDPSSGGLNGTTFLANDASTPPMWTQQQAANVVPPLDANVVLISPALNEFAPPNGGASFLNAPSIFGSSAFGGQTMALWQETFSPSYAQASNRGASSNGSNANPPTGVNGMGEILPLPDLDLAFLQSLDWQPLDLQTLDITSPTGW